jgi:hypothetical protein
MNENRQPWRLTSHICRRCMGRILVGETADGGRVYRCAQCGHAAEGDAAPAVCCCGIRLKTGADAGVRCVINEERTLECPYEVVAEQVAA